MASHRRLHCLLNRLFRPKSNKTHSSASLAFVRDSWIPPMDSPYRGPVTRQIILFDDIIMLCVFNLGTETFSRYVRHPSEQCHLSHGRDLMFVTNVTNIPKSVTLSTLGTHLVVLCPFYFLSLIDTSLIT